MISIHFVWHRSVYQELARLGSPEQQALLHKQLDDLGGPISFCKYKLKLSNDDDASGLSVPDSPSAKVIQVSNKYSLPITVQLFIGQLVTGRLSILPGQVFSSQLHGLSTCLPDSC